MITQPEEVKSAEQKVEDARNSLTILEQDYLRIQKLHASEAYAIGEIQKTKAEISKEVSKLTEEKDSLVIDIKALQYQKMIADGAVTEAKIALSKVEETVAQESRRAEELKSDYTQRGVSLTQREEAVTKREQDNVLNEAKIYSKLEKINSFVASI